MGKYYAITQFPRCFRYPSFASHIQMYPLPLRCSHQALSLTILILWKRRKVKVQTEWNVLTIEREKRSGAKGHFLKIEIDEGLST